MLSIGANTVDFSSNLSYSKLQYYSSFRISQHLSIPSSPSMRFTYMVLNAELRSSGYLRKSRSVKRAYEYCSFVWMCAERNVPSADERQRYPLARGISTRSSFSQ